MAPLAPAGTNEANERWLYLGVVTPAIPLSTASGRGSGREQMLCRQCFDRFDPFCPLFFTRIGGAGERERNPGIGKREAIFFLGFTLFIYGNSGNTGHITAGTASPHYRFVRQKRPKR
jgi:hypothetical protein